MPIHDWSRVDAGIFHDFHTRWIAHLAESMNDGCLPEGFYALAEQRSGQISPDVLALRTQLAKIDPNESNASTAIAVADSPPKVAMKMQPAEKVYALMRRTVTIRHVSDDKIVGLIEIVSKANKDRESTVREFADKVMAAISQGIHVLLVDLLEPGTHDPIGMHGVVWAAIDEDAPYPMPADKPLTLASYVAGVIPSVYIEALAVGDVMPDMPLFLDPDWYVNVPLEATYTTTYRSVPRRWRDVIES